ncbi:CLUMA_CG005561, isoform A [Clunio marinus]|uniref:CLUMA_CG005561, isoform A n=1 Tax=Clunio marinus TaxID=568069 RepID=A0A1J1HV40_9DIPT|nr:CLUMA_CG005561, isoform A [Clunio marinus]
MYLIYQGFPFTKKSSSYNRHYWRCVHQKPLNCKAGIVQIVDVNRFKVMKSEHSHPLITERRKPGEFKALMAKQSENLHK